MPDGPYLTPEEERLQRMLAEGGSPEGAALSLIQRLEDLEAAVAALDTSSLGPVPELEPLEDPAEAPASPEGDAR